MALSRDAKRADREAAEPVLLRDSAAILVRLRQSEIPEIRETVRLMDEAGCGLEQEVLLIAPRV